MNFRQKLEEIIKKNNSLLCVGLDSDLEKIPRHLSTESNPIFAFNKAIIEKTSDLVCCYKLNMAFYESYGLEGLSQLKTTIEYIKKTNPHVPIILDAKREDIPNTAKMYAKAFFEYWDADAITLNLFVGKDGIDPFLNFKERFSFLYLRSSNKRASDFQDIDVGGKPFFRVMAEKVKQWPEENFGIIASATYPEELKTLRDIFPERVFLVPGVGAQEGALQKTVEVGVTAEKSGLIIHSARTIIYAGSGKDFAEKARIEAKRLKERINVVRYEK